MKGSSDSDGPPPLVDSSSDDQPAAGAAATEEESSEEPSGDEYDDFQGVFQQIMMRAQAGPGWGRQPGAFGRGRLALQDRAQQRSEHAEAEAARRAEEAPQRREADERERLRRQEERERQRAKQAHRAVLADTYRTLQVRLEKLRKAVQALPAA